MSIRYVHGSLFDTDCEVIAHGCNCRGGFGKGIAFQVAQRHPDVKVAYMYKHSSLHPWKLGDVQYVPVNNAQYRVVANVATQDRYLPNGGVVHADYPAIKKVMEELYEYCKVHHYRLAIPKIGAGLAGGDWNIIEKIIDDIFIDQEIVIYYI